MSLLPIFFLFSSIIAFGECSQIKAAPYFMPRDNNPPDVNDAIKASGIKHFILSFIVAPDKGGCVPTWDGLDNQKVCKKNLNRSKMNVKNFIQ